MPTAESAQAFAKFVATRERLAEVTKNLNEAHMELQDSGFNAGRAKYVQLQKDWEQAFLAFETATEAFSATVKKLRGVWKRIACQKWIEFSRNDLV